jgi:hypothetical protein
MIMAHFQTLMGGTGLRPVVSGVAPETGEQHTLAMGSTDFEQRTPPDEIRRDARATNMKARQMSSPSL